MVEGLTAAHPGENGGGIRAIARSLGISTGTVSRALNDRYGISAATKERVLAEARKQGYIPNSAARMLKSHPSLNAVVLFSPFRSTSGEINPAALRRIDAFQRAAAAANIAITVRLVEKSLAVDLGDADIAILYGHFLDSAFETIHRAGLPAVVIQHCETPYSSQVSLGFDVADSASNAVRYLAALGHTRIGAVFHPLSEFHAREFLRGYREAVDEFQLVRDEALLIELSPATSNKEGGKSATLALLNLPEPPTSAIYASDWIALGGMRAVKDSGLRVPRDFSIIGFDNLDVASEVDPPLTTFDLQTQVEAENLVRLVLDLGLKKLRPGDMEERVVRIVPRLVRRGSCACVRRNTPTPTFNIVPKHRARHPRPASAT